MITAVVFDCFGVLASDGWLPFKRDYFGADPDRYQQAGLLSWRLDKGELSYPAFLQAVADLAGVTVAAARARIDRNVPDEALFAYLRELKPHYRLGLLSNAGADWLAELFTPAQRALFDAVALSYETGFLKPETEAYRVIADRLGVPAAECVLIDDQPTCSEGARAAGWAAITYQNVAQLRQELESLLGRTGSNKHS